MRKPWVCRYNVDRSVQQTDTLVVCFFSPKGGHSANLTELYNLHMYVLGVESTKSDINKHTIENTA